MRQPAEPVYDFGAFRLNPAERLLVRNGEPVPLTPKAFDALTLLVENAGHLVEKEEFMRRLWPHTFVGDDTLAQNISLLRKVLTDSNGATEWIATVPKRGYRFVGVVEWVNESSLNPAVIGDGQVAEQPSPAPIEAKDGGTGALRYWLGIAAGIFVFAVCAIVTTFVYLKSRPSNQPLWSPRHSQPTRALSSCPPFHWMGRRSFSTGMAIRRQDRRVLISM